MRHQRGRGSMLSVEWQDRAAKEVHGFNVTLADGYSFKHQGGCITIPDELIAEHGRVKKAVAY